MMSSLRARVFALGLVVAVLAALLLWQVLERRDAGADDTRRAEAVKVARAQVIDLTTLDSASVAPKLKAVVDILQSKLHRRGIDLKALTIGDPEPAAGATLKQKITLQDGVPIEKAKEIVRLIKDSKIRVQASIQEKQVRVAGKNRDDLQAVIALVKGKDLGVALQFTNYRST